MSEQMTTAERRATCEACTLAEVMKDCPLCQFDAGEYPQATSADVFRVYRRLWGDYRPQEVQDATLFILAEGFTELVDVTQTPLWIVD
jgi:hypothetical protein